MGLQIRNSRTTKEGGKLNYKTQKKKTQERGSSFNSIKTRISTSENTMEPRGKDKEIKVDS